MSIIAYYDASGHEGSTDPLLEMAAVVATADDWERFDTKWAAALASENVREFHHTDFKSSVRAFQGWKTDEPRRIRLLDSLLLAFEEHVKAWYSVGIDRQTFARVDEHFRLDPLTGPYMLTALATKVVVDDWRNSAYPGKPLRHVFAKGDRGQKPNARLEDLGDNVEVKEKGDANTGYVYGFQVADLVAGEMRTFRKGIAEEDYARIGRKPLQRIFRKTGNIHFIDTWFLGRLCLAHPELYPRRA